MTEVPLAMAFLRFLSVSLLLFVVSPGAIHALDGKPPVVGAMAHFTILDEPKAAPEISFLDHSGAQRSLADWRGKVVLLNFWATWCAPCRREMPALDRLHAELAAEGFEVIALSSDRKGVAATKPFFDKIKIQNLALYVDPTIKAQRAFRVIGLPTTILIDREGREVGRVAGPAEWDNDDAIALIRHYLR